MISHVRPDLFPRSSRGSGRTSEQKCTADPDAMTAANIPAVGIDLGTTYSVVAQARRARTARDPGQRRGRSPHAQRRAAGRQRRGRGQGGHEGHEHRGRPRGRVRQARHGPSRLPSRDRRQAVSARGDPGLDPQQAPRRRHAADRAVRQGGDHGAGLFRRGPPQGHAGRRIHGRLRSAGHHQRADRGGRGLRLPAGFSQRRRQHRPSRGGCWSTTWAAARST